MERIVTMSVVIWAVLDRAKKLWADKPWGKWLTPALAAGAGLAAAFGYGMDLPVTLGLAAEPGVLGKVLTGFALAGGSSCIHELLEKVKHV